MAKLKLNPDPTFTAKVAVPVPGGEAEVKMTFKYRSRAEREEWQKQNEAAAEEGTASDVALIMSIATGWDLDDEFNEENVARLCDAYPRAAGAIAIKYARELVGVREGN